MKPTPKKTIKPNQDSSTLSRRDFFKIGAVGGTLGAAGLAASSDKVIAKAFEEHIAQSELKEQDDFPYEVNDSYKPIPCYSTVHGHGFFGRYLMGMGIEVDKEALEDGDVFLEKINYHHDNERKGYDQVSKALEGGAWAISNTGVGPSPGGVSDYGLFRWRHREDKHPMAMMDADWLKKEKAQFQSKQEASDIIKRAAKLYGADLVGITKRDPRWDYSVQFNPIPPPGRDLFPDPPASVEEFQQMGQMMAEWNPSKFTYGWERAGFEPKSVIVLAFEMDYEGIAGAPSDIAGAAAGEAYSRMAKTSYQLSVFFKQLGYKAIATGNDVGMSVPYAIAAGLGEGSRMGTLINYKYGPRIRLAKVYTEFDFCEYDKPKTFGVFEFCKRCKKCADACPGDAISQDDEPSFEPTHEHKDNPYFNAVGIKKWYMDAKKCFHVWADGGTDCGNCIAACPYNKPDFWHHRLVDSISAAMPGPVHTFMREMDNVFGYGDVDNPDSVDKFYNPKGKNYDGFGS